MEAALAQQIYIANRELAYGGIHLYVWRTCQRTVPPDLQI